MIGGARMPNYEIDEFIKYCENFVNVEPIFDEDTRKLVGVYLDGKLLTIKFEPTRKIDPMNIDLFDNWMNWVTATALKGVDYCGI